MVVKERANGQGSYSIKKLIVNGTMAACVASSAIVYFHPTINKPVKNKAFSSPTPNGERRASANIINKRKIAYTEPKAFARPLSFLVSDKYREADLMKENPEDMINDYTVVKESSFEFTPKTTFKFSGEFHVDKEAEIDLDFDVDNKIQGYSSFDFDPETTFKF
jgi:hypothetical protein